MNHLWPLSFYGFSLLISPTSCVPLQLLVSKPSWLKPMTRGSVRPHATFGSLINLCSLHCGEGSSQRKYFSLVPRIMKQYWRARIADLQQCTSVFQCLQQTCMFPASLCSRVRIMRHICGVWHHEARAVL